MLIRCCTFRCQIHPIFSYTRPDPAGLAAVRASAGSTRDRSRHRPVTGPLREHAGHHGFRIKHHVHEAPAIGRP